MRKRDELTVPGSCMNKAHERELIFVLLGRDPAAPAAIRAWIAERIRLGKNQPEDSQLLMAGIDAITMYEEGRKWVGK